MGILQYPENPGAVDHQVFLGVINRVLVGKVGGKVVDDVGLRLKCPFQLLLIQNVAMDELDILRPGNIPFV